MATHKQPQQKPPGPDEPEEPGDVPPPVPDEPDLRETAQAVTWEL